MPGLPYKTFGPTPIYCICTLCLSWAIMPVSLGTHVLGVPPAMPGSLYKTFIYPTSVYIMSAEGCAFGLSPLSHGTPTLGALPAMPGFLSNTSIYPTPVKNKCPIGRSMAPTSPASGPLPFTFAFVCTVCVLWRLPPGWLVFTGWVVPPGWVVLPGWVAPLWW